MWDIVTESMPKRDGEQIASRRREVVSRDLTMADQKAMSKETHNHLRAEGSPGLSAQWVYNLGGKTPTKSPRGAGNRASAEVRSTEVVPSRVKKAAKGSDIGCTRTGHKATRRATVEMLGSDLRASAIVAGQSMSTTGKVQQWGLKTPTAVLGDIVISSPPRRCGSYLVGNSISLDGGTIIAYGIYRRGLRHLAKFVKAGKDSSLGHAARIFAGMLCANAVIVPMPSHMGRATVMLEVARRLTAIRPDVIVADILEGNPHESLRDAKKANRPLPRVIMKLRGAIPATGETFIIDNVIDTGATFLAARAAIPAARLAVLAVTFPYTRNIKENTNEQNGN